MMTDLMVGLLVTAVPALAVGYLMLNKQPPIFRMFIVMVLVGLGYLTATGAIEDIGARVQGHAAPTPVAAPEAAPAATPTTEAPKAETPAATEAAPTPSAEETKTEAAPAAKEPATTTEPAASETQPEAATTPDAAQPPASTQVDPYPGAPKPAQ